ncbi:MAG: serine/threonine protein phosphatase [Spirochaetaceae bacterium]|nr:serine/threonine protein phosphatase [Spirochaetaceae bacterium]
MAMTEAQFAEGLVEQMANSPEITLEPGTRIVLLGDLHAGDGSSRDDLRRNGPLLHALLERYYLERGSTLVLNGDIEELQKFNFARIYDAWESLYGVFDRFAGQGRLFKIYGNHDDKLLEYADYPYALFPGLRIIAGGRLIYVFHGHQASHFYVKYNKASGALVRYVLGTLGIKNLNVSKNSRRKYAIERRTYGFSRERRLVSIIGHTHRPLFESLSKYDYLRFSIERLCQEYTLAETARRGEIAETVALFKEEMLRLRRKERRFGRTPGLYGRDLLLPCLFNAGCAVGKKGITALEIEGNKIELVYWFEEGKERRYLDREVLRAVDLPGTPYRRAVINSERLDFLFARMDLLA